jgi:hypothetical protein
MEQTANQKPSLTHSHATASSMMPISLETCVKYLHLFARPIHVRMVGTASQTLEILNATVQRDSRVRRAMQLSMCAIPTHAKMVEIALRTTWCAISVNAQQVTRVPTAKLPLINVRPILACMAERAMISLGIILALVVLEQPVAAVKRLMICVTVIRVR